MADSVGRPAVNSAASLWPMTATGAPVSSSSACEQAPAPEVQPQLSSVGSSHPQDQRRALLARHGQHAPALDRQDHLGVRRYERREVAEVVGCEERMSVRGTWRPSTVSVVRPRWPRSAAPAARSARRANRSAPSPMERTAANDAAPITTPSVESSVRMGLARSVWMPTRTDRERVWRLMALRKADEQRPRDVPGRAARSQLRQALRGLARRQS